MPATTASRVHASAPSADRAEISRSPRACGQRDRRQDQRRDAQRPTGLRFVGHHRRADEVVVDDRCPVGGGAGDRERSARQRADHRNRGVAHVLQAPALEPRRAVERVVVRPPIAGHRHVQADEARFMKRREVPVVRQKTAGHEILAHDVADGNRRHPRVGLGEPWVACAEQPRAPAGQRFQIKIRADIAGPPVLQESGRAEQARLLAAVQVHHDRVRERRLARQHAERLDDGRHAGGVVGRSDRIQQGVEVRVQEDRLGRAARQARHHVECPVDERRQHARPIHLGARDVLDLDLEPGDPPQLAGQQLGRPRVRRRSVDALAEIDEPLHDLAGPSLREASRGRVERQRRRRPQGPPRRAEDGGRQGRYRAPDGCCLRWTDSHAAWTAGARRGSRKEMPGKSRPRFATSCAAPNGAVPRFVLAERPPPCA